MTQQELFANQPQATKQCVRCGKRCRVADKRNPNAQLFVKGDIKTGMFCAECLVVDFLRNCERGPQVDELAKLSGKKQFDPQVFRLEHVQQQFATIVAAAHARFGAELVQGEFDWDEVIANWHLPFPKAKRTKR
jgi:hypothetical protein